MKNILVPTDFSKNSFYGLEFSANLARRSGAKIHLFNAALTSTYYYTSDPLVISPPAAVMVESINENLKRASMKKLEKIQKSRLLKGLKVNLNCETAFSVYREIIEYSKRIRSDLIVMGTKGESNLKDIFLGSTAERVVRFSEKPVLVIPNKIKNLNPKLVVFASDFTAEAFGIFPFVWEFAKIFGSKVDLLKINTTDQFRRTRDDSKRMSKFNKKFGSKFRAVIYNDYMKEEGILNYSDQIEADLIAIGTHGKKGLARFFSSDVSEGVVRLSHKPILVVNLKKFKRKRDILKV
ncbi:MAG: universal stress protein [Chlorobi bacterium]|nr:universal stress protein [Chlorobiota bacterium]MCI0715156.1 universal stress protein [Chlorobiota bacterium]